MSRHYGAVKAVDDVSFDILDGEFFAMLGPSGSGKTTCLRLIAGFEQPTVGTVAIHGKDMAGVPPYDRDVNTVFQDYALFPHMTVAENVAYGLMIRKVPAAERAKRAEEMLAMVKLGGFGGRKPSQLSGGQRQRVALARALVNRPSVLLLDEPLGALDLKLREQMQVELKAIQRQVGITFIYVTHDQGEALSMSDRVAVFNQGKVEQMASPGELYERPEDRVRRRLRRRQQPAAGRGGRIGDRRGARLLDPAGEDPPRARRQRRARQCHEDRGRGREPALSRRQHPLRHPPAGRRPPRRHAAEPRHPLRARAGQQGDAVVGPAAPA